MLSLKLVFKISVCKQHFFPVESVCDLLKILVCEQYQFVKTGVCDSMIPYDHWTESLKFLYIGNIIINSVERGRFPLIQISPSIFLIQPYIFLSVNSSCYFLTFSRNVCTWKGYLNNEHHFWCVLINIQTISTPYSTFHWDKLVEFMICQKYNGLQSPVNGYTWCMCQLVWVQRVHSARPASAATTHFIILSHPFLISLSSLDASTWRSVCTSATFCDSVSRIFRLKNYPFHVECLLPCSGSEHAASLVIDGQSFQSALQT